MWVCARFCAAARFLLGCKIPPVKWPCSMAGRTALMLASGLSARGPALAGSVVRSTVRAGGRVLRLPTASCASTAQVECARDRRRQAWARRRPRWPAASCVSAVLAESALRWPTASYASTARVESARNRRRRARARHGPRWSAASCVSAGGARRVCRGEVAAGVASLPVGSWQPGAGCSRGGRARGRQAWSRRLRADAKARCRRRASAAGRFRRETSALPQLRLNAL